jgi:serine-type D-Ala-D-Ala carboxypeptidase/endopeptidase (penicillin-binding protein 4)
VAISRSNWALACVCLLSALLAELPRALARQHPGAAAASLPQAAAEPLPPEIRAIMDGTKYRTGNWGLYVADRASGQSLHELNPDAMVLAASTTKLYSTAAALDAYGADYRFETPIYRRGAIDAAGVLQGDLILVASGDLTMGGRDTPEGRIAFTAPDHAEANILPGATLTPQDPLAGLDELARQVAAAGVRQVTGDVVIDARLFPQTPKDDYVLSPIMINDNLIDLTLTSGSAGQPATLNWRPQTAAYQVRSEVQTVTAGGMLDVTVTAPQPGVILLQGQMPADQAELLRTYQVADPPAFARILLIEALGRQGVVVAAPPTGPNPTAQLPPSGSYTAGERVASLRSLPFAETIRLINKVSMNRQADTLVYLLAVKYGKTAFDDGMEEIAAFLRRAGLDPALVSLSDGRGNEYTDLFSPRTVSQLLRYMATRPDFAVYYDAQPVLGVDGTETNTVPPTSPVRGKAAAKSGTTVAGDAMNERLVLMVRGSAGYLTARSGRELVFGLYVTNVPMSRIEDVFTIIGDFGTIVEALYERN